MIDKAKERLSEAEPSPNANANRLLQAVSSVANVFKAVLEDDGNITQDLKRLVEVDLDTPSKSSRRELVTVMTRLKMRMRDVCIDLLIEFLCD